MNLPLNNGTILNADIKPVLENCPRNDCMKNIGMPTNKTESRNEIIENPEKKK